MIRSVVVFILLSLAPFQSQAVDPRLNWQTLHTDNFQIHFAEQHKAIAIRVARIAESVHAKLSVELNWQPVEKVHLVLSDETDFANGFATVITINRSVLFLSPPTGVAGLEDFDDWLTLLITHEYTHILHLDKVEQFPAGLRNFFGRFLLTFPNVFEPSWLVEGLATFKETDHERGVGRGQSNLFASLMRMEVAKGVKPFEQVNLPIATWPAGGTRYLYGVYFYEFIAETRGEAKVQALVEQHSGNLLPFAVNTSFQQVFGKDVAGMWQEFEQWLNHRFKKQIAEIERKGLIEGEKITGSGYQTGPVRVSGDDVYYIKTDGSHQRSLFRLGEDGPEELVEVQLSANMDVNAQQQILISQVEVCEEFTLYGDLFIYSVEDDEMQRITECGRYTGAVWGKQDDIYAIKHDAGRFELQRLDTQGKLLETLHRFDDQVIAAKLDISPQGDELVFALWKPDYGWNLHTYTISSGRWQALTDDNDIESFPEYTPDGKSIIYSSDHSGVFNLYRYSREEKTHSRLTRAIGGAYQAATTAANDVYYIGNNSDGTDLYRLSDAQAIEQHVTTTGEKIKSYAYDDVAYQQTDYSPWSDLKPRWWFPSVVITDDVTEIGFSTSANDALGLQYYFLTAAYDFENNLPLGLFSYSYSNWFNFNIGIENNLFRNAAAQPDRIRSSDTLQFVFALPQTKLLSSSVFLAALAWEKNTDSKLFSGAIPGADFSDNMFGLAWLYDSARSYPLSISKNDGRTIKLVYENGEVLSGDLTGNVITASWTEYIRLGGEHVLAIQALQGSGDGISSSFRLGGEDTGNSYTILLERTGVALFGRREYPLRGYPSGLPQLRGQNAQLLSAEWRFPGQRIERGTMTPPVAIMQWSGNLFLESGAAYNGSRPNTYYSSAGLEFTADLNLFYLVPVRARLGFAHGFDDVLGDNRAYLSLGSSF